MYAQQHIIPPKEQDYEALSSMLGLIPTEKQKCMFGATT